MVRNIVAGGWVIVCLLSGCSAGEANSERVDNKVDFVCTDPDATNAAVAMLAANIGRELGRWEFTTDFYKYTGYGSQLMVGLTATGLARCGGSCPLVSSLLALQDSRTDNSVVFGSQWLSSSALAARLTAGFDNQSSCSGGGQCPYEAHALSSAVVTDGGNCDMQLFTYDAKTPGGALLTSPSALNNALYWTTDNGTVNPYIAFQSNALTVTIDPTGNLSPFTPLSNNEMCQKLSLTNLNGTPCSCSASFLYGGELRNDIPLTPSTYYCRSTAPTEVCQKLSLTNINDTPCTCYQNGSNIRNGVLRNDQYLTPKTYYCRDKSNVCQWLSPKTLQGHPCTCPARGVVNGVLQPSQQLTPGIYYCN